MLSLFFVPQKNTGEFIQQLVIIGVLILHQNEYIFLHMGNKLFSMSHNCSSQIINRILHYHLQLYKVSHYMNVHLLLDI